MPHATASSPQAATLTPTMPPPQTFDILPPLHSILSRLLLSRDPNDPSSPSPEAQAPIAPKELGAAASTISNKIQRARAAVNDLPGIEVTIEQQETVISDLEEEVRRLNRILEGISAKARDMMAAEDLAEGAEKDESSMELS